MRLASGTRLGSFEVVSVLGAGGMGEVYRGLDTRLNRQVAIKVLPAALADDGDRLTRFQREAELLASLSHPNIAAVYGIEDTSAGKALVMELVEGVDLRERIDRGQLSIDEGLSIALQLARGVAAAHGRGIVHRDLKPANIRLRSDGTLKVLDFGLAKALESGDSQATVTATHAGTILGTPRYMSPEQARGEAAGPQSDIWSFGAILYELFSGRAAFDGGSTADTIAKVLTAEPDYKQLRADLPPRIALLIQRCLRKDPQRRLHHIGDAAIEIEEGGSAADVATTTSPKRNTLALVIAAGLFAVIAIVSALFLLKRPAPSASPVIRSDIALAGGLNSAPYGSRRFAISRDGSRIALAAAGALRVRRLDQEEFTVHPGEALNPFFSDDGSWVAYFDTGENGAGLKKVAASGGVPAIIVPTTERSLGGDWRADGEIVFATTAGLFLVRDDGSDLRSLARPDVAAGQRVLAWPQFLPGTNAVQFTIVPNGPIAGAQIAVLDLGTSKTTIAVQGGAGARYLAGGDLIYASGQQLKRVAFDPKQPDAHGSESIVDGVTVSVAADNGAADFAVADSGTLLFLPSGASATPPARILWVDRSGQEEAIELPSGRYAYPRVSPDDTHIVLDVAADNRDIWVYDVQRRNLSKLSEGATEDMLPLWSRDSRRVFWASDRSGNFDVYSRAADGATPEHVEVATPATEMPTSFSPDGTRLFLFENFRDITVALAPDFKSKTPLLHAEPAVERLAELSPDGHWLAYESNETGETEVFIRPFPNVDERREKVSRAGGRFPLWNPSGNGELFYSTPDGTMMAATIAMTPKLEVRGEKKLFAGLPVPGGISGRIYDYSVKRDRFLVQQFVRTEGPRDTRLVLIVNWASRFERD